MKELNVPLLTQPHTNTPLPLLKGRGVFWNSRRMVKARAMRLVTTPPLLISSLKRTFSTNYFVFEGTRLRHNSKIKRLLALCMTPVRSTGCAAAARPYCSGARLYSCRNCKKQPAACSLELNNTQQEPELVESGRLLRTRLLIRELFLGAFELGYSYTATMLFIK